MAREVQIYNYVSEHQHRERPPDGKRSTRDELRAIAQSMAMDAFFKVFKESRMWKRALNNTIGASQNRISVVKI